jgi:hypothetical protein
MKMVIEGDAGWGRLVELWNGEGRPGYLVVGATTYQVFTPEGESLPKFQEMGISSGMYGSTSTGFPQVKTQKPRTEKAGKQKRKPST